MTPGMWTVSIGFAGVALIVLLLNLIPAYRSSRVATLSKSVGLAVTPELLRPLASRLTRRSLISWTAAIVGLLAVVASIQVGVLPSSGETSNASDLWLIFGGITIGFAAGAISNALTLSSVLPAGDRYARSGAVEVSDYLAPIDLIGTRVAVAIGLVALVAWFALIASGIVTPEALVSVGVAVIALAIISLVVFELATRRIINRGQPVASPTELAWDDALRAMSMRSIASAPMSLGVWGALALSIDLAGMIGANPSVSSGAFIVVVGAGIVVFAGIFAAAVVSIATKPQQHYLRRLWPEVAAAPVVKAV